VVEPNAMRPSLEEIMLRKSIGSMESDRTTCSGCGRTPLPGEFLHRLESSERLCGLCLAEVPDGDRVPRRSERVGAAERGLSVAPRAA
jgi:hypothetical protein